MPTRGIGLETAKVLARATSRDGRAYHVIIGSRTLAKGEAAAAAVRAGDSGSRSASAVQLDVTDSASIAAAAATVAASFGRLDVLVNNTGVLATAETEGGSLVAALRRTLDVNLIGAAAVTEAFLPLLLADGTADPRLVFVGSSMGSLAGASDPSSRYYRSVLGPSPLEYRVSKAGLNMLMVEYYKKLGTGEGRQRQQDEGACLDRRSRPQRHVLRRRAGPAAGHAAWHPGRRGRRQRGRVLCAGRERRTGGQDGWGVRDQSLVKRAGGRLSGPSLGS